MYDQLTKQISATLITLQEELRQIETLHEFGLRIKIEGRTEGDLKLAYSLAPNNWDNDPVKGHNLDAVVAEFKRRHGWEKLNGTPLLCKPVPAIETSFVEVDKTDEVSF